MSSIQIGVSRTLTQRKKMAITLFWHFWRLQTIWVRRHMYICRYMYEHKPSLYHSVYRFLLSIFTVYPYYQLLLNINRLPFFCASITHLFSGTRGGLLWISSNFTNWQGIQKPPSGPSRKVFWMQASGFWARIIGYLTKLNGIKSDDETIETKIFMLHSGRILRCFVEVFFFGLVL